jgi:hypothetical protein
MKHILSLAPADQAEGVKGDASEKKSLVSQEEMIGAPVSTNACMWSADATYACPVQQQQQQKPQQPQQPQHQLVQNAPVQQLQPQAQYKAVSYAPVPQVQ